MHQVTVEQAMERLRELIEAAINGEDVVITQDGEPVVRLAPVAARHKRRVPGLNRGAVWMSEDFDEPLPEDFWKGPK